jgi:predicted Zn-dependent peptidase
VTDEEIATAREVLESRWRERMESISGAAEAYSEDAAFGLSRVRDYPGRVAKVTKDDLVRVANGYLSPGALHVLFLGEDRWLGAESLGMGGATSLDLSK